MMSSSKQEQLNQLLAKANETQAVANQACRELGGFLLASLERLVPAGTVIDLRSWDLPPHLASLKTISGTDRGTHIFRIEQVVGVQANATTPTLSHWTCDAVPVSETTGKDMLASAGKRNTGLAAVHMRGTLSRAFAMDMKKSMVDELDRMVTLLTTSEPYAPGLVDAPPVKTPSRPRKPTH